MKITKAKLIKGQFLEVIFSDGISDDIRNYPNTEASPRLKGSFNELNKHLAALTEQYNNKGELATEFVQCRGYSIKGDGEKEGLTLTGIRLLSTGRSITIPSSPFLQTESDGAYGDIDNLLEAVGNCRASILEFMENNKAPKETQGSLFGQSKTIILNSQQTETVEETEEEQE